MRVRGCAGKGAGEGLFTARDLTPLAKAGYIAVVDTVNLHSPQRKYRLAAKGRRWGS